MHVFAWTYRAMRVQIISHWFVNDLSVRLNVLMFDIDFFCFGEAVDLNSQLLVKLYLHVLKAINFSF